MSHGSGRMCFFGNITFIPAPAMLDMVPRGDSLQHRHGKPPYEFYRADGQQGAYLTTL